MNYDILGVKLPIRLLKIYTELFLQNRFDKRNNSFLKSESLFFSNFDWAATQIKVPTNVKLKADKLFLQQNKSRT